MTQGDSRSDEGRAKPRAGSGPGFFAGLRIRKKLMVLHTLFSLGLSAILLVSLQPALQGVVEGAEADEARQLLLAHLGAEGPRGTGIRRGDPHTLGLDPATIERARAAGGEPVRMDLGGERGAAVAWTGEGEQFVLATARSDQARRAVLRLYGLVVLAVLLAYALIAGALELFVLPQHVYGPIRRLLRADRAAREGRRDEELVEEATISPDELGEIMRSRNETIRSLRRHEGALADALVQLESVAADLKRKNHLLETARRNLADADRLASLGMMSAGIAHELNTPLAVVKGLAEKLEASGDLSKPERALLVRVVARLERLGESLLDFARVRPPESAPARLGEIVDHAWTLVSLDREAAEIGFRNEVGDAVVWCDADRMVQVFVNLLRNAVDAMNDAPADEPRELVVTREEASKDGARWVSISIVDSGPGIPPGLLSTLFEPFVSTRLDARGTGLGLAVADGIVREHGGVIVARNRADGKGAAFEVLLPLGGSEPADVADPGTDARVDKMAGHG